MSRIKEVFFRDIEQDIAPVIYFHQLEPDTWEIKTLKAISLLEMNGEQLPVTALF